MARIRTIKPEFWSDEKLSPLPDSVRLLFLGLISMADDCGRLLDSPKQIEAFVWPCADRSRETREGLATLSRLSRIVRGTTANGQQVIQIANWTRHQRVDKPSLRSALPEIVVPSTVPEDSRDIRDTLANDSRSDLGPWTMDHGPGTVEQEQEPRATTAAIAQAAIDLSVAANRAIGDRFGEQASPILASDGRSHEVAEAVLSAGIPLAFAAASIARQVRDTVAKPVRTLRYFLPGIREDWAKHHERVAAAGADPVQPLERETPPLRGGKPTLIQALLNDKGVA